MTQKKIGIISEVLGVPTNIENVSKKVYKYFIGELIKDKDTVVDPTIEYDLQLKGPFTISDFKVLNIGIKVNFITTDEVEKPILYGMAFTASGHIDKKTLQLKPAVTNNIRLVFRFVVPESKDVMFSEILDLVKSEEDEFISSISHELLHAYENYKKPIESSKERARYSGIQGVNFGLPPVRMFLHYLYFISATENVVRPTEVNSLMKSSKVKREKFIEFITSNKVYKTYKEASEFTVEKFKSDLMGHMNRINEILERVGELDIYKTNEQKVDRLLDLLYFDLTREIIDGYKQVLATDMFEFMFGFSGKKAIAYYEFVEEIQKYKDNPHEFFYVEIEKMHNTSTKMMKKLSKLYALIGTKKSIKNWDIHDKITKKTQIENFYRY